ncbi:MAG: magnesium chelatase domain-containing protein, partial [Candidatus Cloacimonadaceae bacterium]
MVGNVFTYATFGIDALQLNVECDTYGSAFGVTIVGMATRAVQESKERIFAALRNSGVHIPTRFYTINLAP